MGRVGTDAERADWLRQVADAAEKAAERLRALDDPGNGQLLKDLEELRQRLLAELHPSDEPV